MKKDELETTLDELEQEVMDELENPYRPYRVEFPYEVRFTIPNDDHNTEITIRTRSEEIRFGNDEQDILLQKEVDNRYGKETYSKHILNWVSKRLPDIDPRECDLEYVGTPKVAPLDHQEVKEFIEGCLNDDE
jgi:hypothetical protein